jgi:hypothetical protein
MVVGLPVGEREKVHFALKDAPWPDYTRMHTSLAEAWQRVNGRGIDLNPMGTSEHIKEEGRVVQYSQVLPMETPSAISSRCMRLLASRATT